MTTHFRTVDVGGTEIFCREVGDRGRPTILLLHGFPSSSHMFRDLIPELADDYHVIAPDLPGFGQSAMKPRDAFSYTFDNIADVMDRFTVVAGLMRFAIYIFDYGAPVGLRIATKHPKRITAIITQNGNSYLERPVRCVQSGTGLLGRSEREKPRRASGLPHSADDAVSVHPRRHRSEPGLA